MKWSECSSRSLHRLKTRLSLPFYKNVHALGALQQKFSNYGLCTTAGNTGSIKWQKGPGQKKKKVRQHKIRNEIACIPLVVLGLVVGGI